MLGKIQYRSVTGMQGHRHNNVLRCFLNVTDVVMSRMSAGNSFQASGAAVENDLDPKAVSERGMSKWPR